MQLEKTIVVIKTIIIWKDYLNNMTTKLHK